MEAVHLERSDENVREIAALHGMLGSPAGLEGLLDDLKYQARWSLLPRLLGRAVRRGIAFDSYDQRDRRWWPQGISTSADSSDDEVVAGADGQGRRVLVVTWYSHEVDGVNQGSRVTFLDLDTLRYRHVLLVVPTLDEEGRLVLEPLRVHAGGIVWIGPWLHIAATSRGFVTARVDDIIAVAGDDERPDDFGVHEGRVHSYGHHYVLPVRFRYRARSEDPTRRLRHSFMSLSRGSRPPMVVCGEYGRSGQSTRFASYEIDPVSGMLVTGEDGFSRSSGLDEGGIRQMQGVAVVDGTYHVSVSQGPWLPGSVFTGVPGSLRRHRWAVPMGPEDLSYWPSRDSLWSVTEHPHRRWVVEMPRSRFSR
ncbi:MAG TPA: hypothetical protein VF728_00145 [Nocardioides sp.]